jgi:hypothetical protein
MGDVQAIVVRGAVVPDAGAIIVVVANVAAQHRIAAMTLRAELRKFLVNMIILLRGSL